MKLTLLEALNISLTGFVVVLIVLAMLAIIIVLLSKVIRIVEGRSGNTIDIVEEKTLSNNIKSTPAVQPTSVASAPVYCDGIELYKTDYKTAATIMAIVSHESGIPLNRLQFTSIKLDDKLELNGVDDKTAATIMAVVSHQSGIPLDRLVFKSIKQINN